MLMGLSREQVSRYSRQLLVPEFGVKAQERLLKASVAIIGAGGLGSPAAFYLAGSGIGRLAIIDGDVVTLDNLHRQILHTTDRVGTPKADSAAKTLAALNPDIQIIPHRRRITAENALEELSAYDLVLDGSDNFSTRYLVNDACVLLKKPLVYGGVIGLKGQVLVILPGQSACFRCVFSEPPLDAPNCQQAGVVGAAAGVIGSLMAQEAIKVIAGIGEPLINRLVIYEGLQGRFREVALRRDARCAVCGNNPAIQTLVPVSDLCAVS